MSDRTIHAAAGEWFIVRYERAGKWFIEYEPPRGRSAQRIDIAEAVQLACDWEEIAGGHIYTGMPGGSRFDYLVRERKAATNDGEDAPPNGERGA